MAKRRSNNNGEGCLTIFVILIIIGFLQEFGPYILIIGGISLVIWLLVKIFNGVSSYNKNRINIPKVSKRNQAQLQNSDDTNFDNSPNVLIYNINYPVDNVICYEIDRQIKDTLLKRKDIEKNIKKLKRDRLKHNMFWMKNDSLHIAERNRIDEEIKLLESRLNVAKYRFNVSANDSYNMLNNCCYNLFQSNAHAYDATPSSDSLFVSLDPKGDMRFIEIGDNSICISINEDIFCIIPYYIVHFKINGTYVSTYSSSAIKASLIDITYTEKVAHTTWQHVRVDGRPDLRYKDNAPITYYTDNPRTITNVLAIDIIGYRLKYLLDTNESNSFLSAVKSYNDLKPIKTYDPVYHLIRLLKECDETNTTLLKLQNIL